jgi:tetratricopeptide (TPR) repeat protein
MKSREKDMLTDQGDWYSDLFNEEGKEAGEDRKTAGGSAREETPGTEAQDTEAQGTEAQDTKAPPTGDASSGASAHVAPDGIPAGEESSGYEFPGGEPQGDISAVEMTSEEQPSTEEAPETPTGGTEGETAHRGRRKRDTLRRRRGWVPITFFLLTCLLITATVLFLFHRADGYSFALLPSPAPEKPVTSLLTGEYRHLVRADIYRLLRLEKNRLLEVERAIARLESERSAFLAEMDEQKAAYEKNRSIFGLTGDEREIRTIAGLVRDDVEFSGEMRRRMSVYDLSYQRQLGGLLEAKSRLEDGIGTLGRQYREVESGAGGSALSPSIGVLDSTHRAYVERMLTAARQGDFEGAFEAADALEEVTTGPEEETVRLIKEAFSVADTYDRRLRELDSADPLERFTRSFLAEDYDRLLNGADGEKYDYIEPLLSGLRGALFRNVDLKKDARQDLAKRREQREQVAQARGLEEGGEYEKALGLYEDLLLQDMEPYDREYLLERVRSLWLPVEMQKVKREENTKAIKYLESARILSREGRDDDAIGFYRMLIEECPNSDYVGEALGKIVSLSGLQVPR